MKKKSCVIGQQALFDMLILVKIHLGRGTKPEGCPAEEHSISPCNLEKY